MTTRFLSGVVFATGFVLLGNSTAYSRPQYLKGLRNVYPALGKVKCSQSHVGKSKKNKNDFGNKLWIALDKQKNVKNTMRIHDALRKIGPPPMPKAMQFSLFSLWNLCGKLSAESAPKRPCEYRPAFHTNIPALRTRKPHILHIAIFDDRRRNTFKNQHLF